MRIFERHLLFQPADIPGQVPHTIRAVCAVVAVNRVVEVVIAMPSNTS